MKANERRKAAMMLRMQGKNNVEIAAMLGVKKQRISQYFASMGVGHKHYRPIRGVKYVGIREWLWAHQMSWKGLIEAMGYSYVSETLTRWKAKLTGEGHTLTINDINKLLALTGMTFEEAFREG